MKMIGDEVYIQRGETWSLDFEVKSPKGHPYVILKDWQNPYLVTTVAAALYEQEGDYRESHWLDLNYRYVIDANGNRTMEPIKKFVSAEPLSLTLFSISEAMAYYGKDVGGKLVLDSTSDFDIKNFLFFIDEYSDGNYIYKYVKSYTLDDKGDVKDEKWESYNFRIVEYFDTKDWMEQGYLFDVKVLSGTTLRKYVEDILRTQNTNYDSTDWSDEEWLRYIDSIQDREIHDEVKSLYDEGAPLLPNYDTRSLILEPTPIYVSVNLQGGVRKWQ